MACGMISGAAPEQAFYVDPEVFRTDMETIFYVVGSVDVEV